MSIVSQWDSNIPEYRILSTKSATPNKGALHSLEEANSIINVQNTHSFLNNCPIFNPKPPLESSERQLSPHNIRSGLANTSGALIRKNTVSNKFPSTSSCSFECSRFHITSILFCRYLCIHHREYPRAAAHNNSQRGSSCCPSNRVSLSNGEICHGLLAGNKLNLHNCILLGFLFLCVGHCILIEYTLRTILLLFCLTLRHPCLFFTFFCLQKASFSQE